MKVFVIHDNKGKIRGVVTSLMDNVGVKAARGMKVHTMEKEDLESAERRRYVIDLHKNFKVETTSGKSRVVQRPRKKS